MTRATRGSLSALPCLLLVAALLVGAPLDAQITEIVDISPDNSDHDPIDPDGATGGRVTGIVVDPTDGSVLYAASEWGGIYKTVDAGLTWQKLDGHRPTATWDVAIDPSNTDRVYATSFYDGRETSQSQSGINVSTDGGATWTHPASANPPGGLCINPADETERTAFGISIDPTNNANVYVGTSCGLAFSTDSGATWSYEAPPAGGDRMWDVMVSADGSFVDTCGDSGHWVMDTTTMDWSQSPTQQLPSGRCSLAASPYDQGNRFAVVSTTIYEANSAGEWTETRDNPTPQGRIPFVATNPRSTAPAGDIFDLWFGDVSLFQVACDRTNTPSCGTGNSPPWNGPYTRDVGGHDDMGDIAFDPLAGNDACPILMSSDGGVYWNTETTSPDCHSPEWEQPDVTPHGLWPFGMGGSDRPGAVAEDLYFGNQDNGVFGTLDAGAAKPDWDNEICCDGFDAGADDFDDGTVLYSVCCFGGGKPTRYFLTGPKFAGGGEINYPPGLQPSFKFPDSYFNFEDQKWVLITRGASGGVFVTHNIDEQPIEWIELGAATKPPTVTMCGVKGSLTKGGVPVFYVQVGSCNATGTTDRLFRYIGTEPNGEWQELFLPQGGFGVFDVDASDATRLLASGFTATDAFMYKSDTGGNSWTPIPQLDDLMRGGGDFPILNSRGPTDFTGMSGYRQPSLVALDPFDPDVMLAGGRDSGIFLSTDKGSSWTLITDPRDSHTSGVPHIPRPRFAYFDEEGNDKSFYIGSQGRGIWRFGLEEQPSNVGLSVEGSCPGLVMATVTGAPPNTEVGVVSAANDNGFTKGGTVCGGTQFEVGEPFKLPATIFKVDGSGTGTKEVELDADKCWMEAMTITTCETSGAVLVE